jgi:hypothetical protein
MEIYLELRNKVLSLYIGLDVLCLFEDRVLEFAAEFIQSNICPRSISAENTVPNIPYNDDIANENSGLQD